jgi:membrane peptidoglycan carboxypeptidase
VRSARGGPAASRGEPHRDHHTQRGEGFESLPLELDSEPTPQRTTVLDRKGEVLAYFYSQNRQDVPLRKISPVMQRAIIAIEDSRYYEHGAIDVRATIRAFVSNAADNSTQGGSSITQQLVKQILLTQAKTRAERVAAVEQTYERKLRELQYALAYEQRYSKKKILQSYLNIAYFGSGAAGGGAYGVQEAAQQYFSVDADQLNLLQSALIAGLVKNPSAYDPDPLPRGSPGTAEHGPGSHGRARHHQAAGRRAFVRCRTRPEAEPAT